MKPPGTNTTIDANASAEEPQSRQGVFRALGLGLVTGAADDDPSAIGTYAAAGAHKKPRDGRKFYATIVVITIIAMSMNFFGLNPMKALVFSGIVQGFSTPPPMLLIMLMTNNRAIMGKRVNGRLINTLGWISTGTVFAATAGLIVTWLL